MSSYADKLKQFGAGIKDGLNNWYSAYQERQAAQDAKNPSKMTRPEWQDPGSSQDMKSVYDQIMNRKDFQFDLNGNALYQQLRNSYEKQGQLGAMNAIGAASAMTGGYGNSYAAAAGQQAYQQSLEDLNNKIPDLYSMALQQYQMQGEQLAQKYAVAADDRAFQYGVYRDKVGDWENDRGFYYQQQRDKVADSQWDAEMRENSRQFDENLSFQEARARAQDEQWNKQFGYQQLLDERNYNYQVGRDAVADEQWNKTFNANEDQRQIENALARDYYGLEVDKFGHTVKEDELNRKERQERYAVEDEQWDKTFYANEDQRKIENALAQNYYNLDYSKYLSDEDQRKITNALAQNYYNLDYSKYLSDEDQRKSDNAYRDLTLHIDLQKDARNWNYQVQQDAQDRQTAAEQTAFNNNLALAQFNWGKTMDIKNLMYNYNALGLKYG